jgi:hypothetical protein
VSPLLSPALTAKINETEQALKARIMELEEELPAARNTARPKNDHLAETKKSSKSVPLGGSL